MELCPVSIESVLERHAKKNIRLPDDVFLAYLRQFHEGLSYLHDHNVLHRDLKPANILLDKNETLKIIDFEVDDVSEAFAINLPLIAVPAISWEILFSLNRAILRSSNNSKVFWVPFAGLETLNYRGCVILTCIWLCVYFICVYIVCV